MIRYLLAFLFFAHGIIHLVGFIKAFDLANLDHQLKLQISKPIGIIWLANALMFFYVVFLYLTNRHDWFYYAFAAVLVSQILVFAFWSDAKVASLVNLLIASIALVSFSNSHFEREYLEDARENMKTEIQEAETLTNEDLDHLPEQVKKYLEYAGVVGKPKVVSVKVRFGGKMRKKRGAWFSFVSEQYNFFENPARLFFMKSQMNGLPAYGYHSYGQQQARMTIKLMSLFTVLSVENEQLYKAETVTFFNDMCVLAPATLIDRTIQWREVDERTVEATYADAGVSISATLHFNDEGQLVNFVSDDRYEIGDMKQYRFSTPLKDYKNINGFNLASYGEAIWHYPEGDFAYGEFRIKSVEYNVKDVE